MQHTETIVTMREECLRMGLTMLPPDVNRSWFRFTVPEPGAIRYGLGAIKGAGQAALEGIIDEREHNGPFKDLFDFCKRVDTRKANKRVLEALICSGAMDGFGLNRPSLLKTLPKALQLAEATAASADSGQNDLFGLGGGNAAKQEPQVAADIEADWSQRELLAREHATLGFYLSGHPLEAYGEITGQVCSGRLHELIQQHAVPQPVDAKGKPIWQPRTRLMFAAWVRDVRFFKGDGRGGASYKLTLEDRSSQISTWIDADKWSPFASFVKPEKIVFVIAEIGLSPAREGREPEPRLYAPEFMSLDDVLRHHAVQLTLDWRGSATDVLALRKRVQALRGGQTSVAVRYRGKRAVCELEFGTDWKLRLDDETVLGLQDWLGADGVRLHYKRYVAPIPQRRFAAASAGSSFDDE